jgi:hypothetical protein
VLLAKIAAHLERQTVEQSRQLKKLYDLHAEMHHRDTSKRSDKIENAGIRRHVEVLEEASSSFAHVGDLLAAYASGASSLSADQAAILAEKCDQGKHLCEDQIQYHEECDRLGFDVAKELLVLRERGKRDPLELGLEEKAINSVNKRQSAKSDKSEKPTKKANTTSNPSQPVFQHVWYSPNQGFQPAPPLLSHLPWHPSRNPVLSGSSVLLLPVTLPSPLSLDMTLPFPATPTPLSPTLLLASLLVVLPSLERATIAISLDIAPLIVQTWWLQHPMLDASSHRGCCPLFVDRES